MIPVIALMAYKAGGVANLDWLVTFFLATTVFTASAGPVQTLFAYRLAAPSVRREKRWFWLYLLVSVLAYTEFKNVVARLAQLKGSAASGAGSSRPATSPPSRSPGTRHERGPGGAAVADGAGVAGRQGGPAALLAAGTADDRAAAEVTHQLVGTLGSYRRTEGAAAAVRLDDLLRAGEAHPAGEHEDALIAVMERTVSR